MKILKGIPGSVGVKSGKIFFYEKKSSKKAKISLSQAISNASENIDRLYEKTLAELGENHAKIFSAYKMILEDKTLFDPIDAMIASGKEPVEAVDEVTSNLSKILLSKKSEYMRQRADDILFIGQMIKDELCINSSNASLPDGNEKIIVAAKDLTPVDTMLFDTKRLAGLATENGGATSHTVILAKSLGIPAVVGIKNIECVRNEEFTGFIDGYTGELIVNPDGVIKSEFEKRVSDEENLQRRLSTLNEESAYTADGEKIKVAVNVGSPKDIKGANALKFDGVGLFRSEFLYSETSSKPSVQEQAKSYKAVIDAVYPESVTIRTIDVGGDKQLAYLNMKKEENPFLGNRGIRLCLKNEDIFREQLEAILIAAEGKKIQIMLPMITSVNEIEDARGILNYVSRELSQKGIAHCKDVLLGIMAETPACVIDIDILSEHCDFISIGTNDLLQYIMAADRGNSDVKNMYDPYHLSFLRMVKRVIQEGEKRGKEVSVCGDLAANTSFTELLLGMGLKKFSVPLPMANRIKYKIGSIRLNDAKALAEKVLSAKSTQEIKNLMNRE